MNSSHPMPSQIADANGQLSAYSTTMKTAMKTVEISDLIEHMRHVQVKVDALATLQRELREELALALERAAELHRRTLEAQNDVGGEG